MKMEKLMICFPCWMKGSTSLFIIWPVHDKGAKGPWTDLMKPGKSMGKMKTI